MVGGIGTELERERERKREKVWHVDRWGTVAHGDKGVTVHRLFDYLATLSTVS